jgi:hypothetical protein
VYKFARSRKLPPKTLQIMKGKLPDQKQASLFDSSRQKLTIVLPPFTGAILKLSLITKSVPPICTKSVPLGKSKLVNVIELS